jgi:hypothetical protein
MLTSLWMSQATMYVPAHVLTDGRLNSKPLGHCQLYKRHATHAWQKEIADFTCVQTLE